MLKKILLSLFFLLNINIYSYANTESKNNSIIIFGTDKKQEELSLFIKKNIIKSNLNIYSDEKIENDILSSYNIVLIGYSNSNKIMNFTNYIKTNFPFSFSKEYFTFANTFYNNPYNAIVFKYPSPFNPKFYVLIYYSNTLKGLENIIKKVNLGNKDYIIIDHNSKIIREGNFKKNISGWFYDDKLDFNYQKEDISYIDFKSFKTTNFNLNFKENSFVSSNINNYSNKIENYLTDFIKKTNIIPRNKIKLYIFDLKEEKINYENFYKKDETKEIYVVYNKNNDSFIEEFSLFIFNNYINLDKKEVFKNAFIEFSKDLYSNKLKNKCLELYKNNKLSNLLDLVKGKKDPYSDIILGSFTKYLIEKYGIDSYQNILNNAQKISTKEDLLANISNKLNVSFSRLEREWKYYLSEN
ncbi:MAG: hypothetical protein KatS3mg068_1435 [Candidatus Sericytochromatia bacterium]|nr:MAG: hypothetical protein KatS3mg068_1435 [Candidatus Sericytochromatia bacterium]